MAKMVASEELKCHDNQTRPRSAKPRTTGAWKRLVDLEVFEPGRPIDSKQLADFTKRHKR